jgi:cation:H+ antiporter
MVYWFLGGGLVLLLFGGEAVVRGGVAVTRALNLPPLLIGLLVITGGTAAPEFSVSIEAARAGSADIALGNVLGSNILNLLLILGFASLIRPLPSSPKVVLRDGGAMLFAALALTAMSLDGKLSAFEGIAMLAGFALYLLACFFSDWRRSSEHSVPCARAIQRLQGDPQSATAGVFIFLFGLVGLAVGAHFTVAGAIGFARAFHLSEATVGLTVVACGASLPELIVTLIATGRGQSQIAVGHLIASNVFNTLGAIGLTAALTPMKINPALGSDLLVMTAASALLLPLLATSWRLTRMRGALLVLSYACYLVFLAWRQGLLAPAMAGLG